MHLLDFSEESSIAAAAPLAPEALPSRSGGHRSRMPVRRTRRPRRDPDTRAVRRETSNISIKAPGPSANGMQCTDEGIWTIDVAGSRTDTPGRCKVYLSSYAGKLLRELAPEGIGPSGIGVDADNKTIWIGSTS